MKVITTHVGMDFDALASLVAAKKLYPEAKICLPTPISSEVRQFMAIYGKIISHLPAEEMELSQVTQLILVDTRWVNRIGAFRELVGREKVKIHIYDHHPPPILMIFRGIESSARRWEQPPVSS